MFVKAAPNSEHRERIFAAFELWVASVQSLCPAAILWVNGGFVTYKQEPPKDVDVIALCKPGELNALSDADMARFEALLTVNEPNKPRIQPMGGLVDGFFVPRGDIPGTLYWQNAWGSIYGPDGKPIPNETKGYLEVKLSV